MAAEGSIEAPFSDRSTQSPKLGSKKQERIIQWQMKANSQINKNKSAWCTAILKISLTPDPSDEAEKTDAQGRTEGKVGMRGTKALSNEAA
ncbi:MAG: hypothetical protein AMJ88_13130 [Anaerolineae bacterium SM23_ 63]|nr:MAG: hypothetical protein AMJ88_13130 [Anaerolineae bacterium SM23_ 63]